MGSLRMMIQTTVPSEGVTYRRYRTCDRKKVYPTSAAGWAAVRHIQKNGNDQFPEFELRPYTCEFCHKIHVGHSNTPKSSEARSHGEVQLTFAGK